MTSDLYLQTVVLLTQVDTDEHQIWMNVIYSQNHVVCNIVLNPPSVQKNQQQNNFSWEVLEGGEKKEKWDV